MNIPNHSILNPTPGDPSGYLHKNGLWAAVPWGKKFVIIHNGQQVHQTNNLAAAKKYIAKESKTKK